MKKLITLFLGICAVVSVSCSSGLDPDLTESGNPADLITTNGSGSSGSMTAVADFINKHKGVYYEYVDGNDNGTVRPYGIIRYKFIDGRVDIINGFNKATDIIGQPVQAVLSSANKLQISNYADGTIEVLNMSDKGLESYTSYILQKVSDDVLIKNEGVGAFDERFIPYKGTYNSIAKDNKIENYIAIDGEGNIFFHDKNVKVQGGKVGLTDGELTILESYNNTLRKIIFKFDQGVYRRYSIDGKNRDLTYIGVCEVTKDFIEDLPLGHSVYQSGRRWTDKYTSKGYGDFPEEFKFNQPIGSHGGMIQTRGSVTLSGRFYSETAGREIFSGRDDFVANITILKGKDLILMGPYWGAKLTFSDDYSTLTHTLKDGTVLTFKGVKK